MSELCTALGIYNNRRNPLTTSPKSFNMQNSGTQNRPLPRRRNAGCSPEEVWDADVRSRGLDPELLKNPYGPRVVSLTFGCDQVDPGG